MEELHELIFSPLGMDHAYRLHYSEPMKPSDQPMANFSMHGTKLNSCSSFGRLHYAGGGVVAPLEDYLKFMKALTSGTLLSFPTLELMIQDADKLFPGKDYGFGIWKLNTIPVLLPKSYYSWGCVGATGALYSTILSPIPI